MDSFLFVEVGGTFLNKPTIPNQQTHNSQRRAFGFRDDRGTADRETKIAVACHDLGEIARLHPRGGKIMSLTPEAKTCVFSAMELPDADCKRETLLCMQKMMVAAVAQ